MIPRPTPSDIPALLNEIRWDERTVVGVFAPNERLYLRFEEKDWIVDGKLISAGISFPRLDQSMNRESLSRPEHVLIPDWLGWGIVEIVRKDIPPMQTDVNGNDFHFFAIHKPILENKAHSEIDIRKNYIAPRNEPGNKIKKWFRTEFARRTNVLLSPI